MSKFLSYFYQISKLILYIFFCLFLVEILSRVYLNQKYEASLLFPMDSIFHFYPELKEFQNNYNMRDSSQFKVLLLGGSVINSEFSSIETNLKKELKKITNKNVQIYNLAIKAHTSLDSYYKYRFLENYKFDLLILYHGINEIRANNCPEEIFKENYSHYAWYDELNYFFKWYSNSIFSLPVSISIFINSINNKINKREFVNPDFPRKEWLKFGSKIKTSNSFQRNIEEIIKQSQKNNTQMMLMTFAYYLPRNYDIDQFFLKNLKYEGNIYPVELWGYPKNVKKCLEAHNKVIKLLAENYPEILFVDQKTLIPNANGNYNDVCHFTDKGSKLFVSNLIYVLKSSNN